MVSPNPCADDFSITIEGISGQSVIVQIIDIIGNVRISDQLSLAEYANPLRYSVSDLPSGLYFVRVSSQNQSQICRLIKR